MTFTEQDAKNDGLIKREVGREMAKVAQTQNPEVYEHFVRVCEEVGREPADVFGEMAVRALDSEEYADRVLGSELSMKQLRADEIRLEDVQYVKQLSEELGLNEKQESNDPIDKLIDERLQSITRSPVPRLNRNGEGQKSNNKEMAKYMEQMSKRLEEMESRLNDGGNGQTTEEQSGGGEAKSTDELFDEIGQGGESDNSDDGGTVEEEEVTDEQVEEAMEGTGMEVDGMPDGDDGDENAFMDIDDEVEVSEDDGDSDGGEAGNPFSSMEAKEE